MAWESVQGTARLISHAAGVSLRRMIVALETGPFTRWRWPGPTPERLVIAPQDIRTTDPTRAADIYGGLFVFSGQVVDADGRSPFEVEPPSEVWARQLHGFAWLRHLRAADGALTRQNARALVADWIAQEARAPRLANEPEVLARRVLAWITQSPLILEDADRGFYRRFMKSLVRQVRRLRLGFTEAPDGYPRLLTAIAVAEAALSMDGQTRLIRQAGHRLDAELDRQVLADGGHISRNPAVVLELLTDLLPLKQAYTARGLNPSPAVLGAVDRMMPMLRFFRHTDGAFAQFNGMGATPADQLATVLAHDDARGRPVMNATHSGYQRIEADGTVLIMDTGGVPPLPVSQTAHAGFLSFELSSGANRFIVNCGSSTDERWRHVARSTAAHSTLTLEDASSARFVERGLLRRRVGTLMMPGPRDVAAHREPRGGGEVVVARHDGYMAGFGYVHERTIFVADTGGEIVGTDRLVGVGSRTPGRDHYAIRFHLHPAIRATATAGGDVLLVAPDGEAWTFSSAMVRPELSESVYLSAVHGRRKSVQIVLAGRASVVPEVAWTLTRTASGQRGRASTRGRSGEGGPDLFQ